MPSTSSPPSTEPSGSAQSTLFSTPTASNVRIQTPEAPASLDDLLKSPHNPAFQTRQPSSTFRGASADDPRRRSGFHLWRTESEDARTVRLRQAVEAAEAQANAPQSLSRRLTNVVKAATDRLTSHRLFSLYRRNSIHLPDDEEEGPPTEAFTLREPRLTKIGLIVLTISLAGAQVAWTLELAYGTPYLLSLGLSEQSTSLVWLAGPLSGLIAQPVVGSLSDHSTSSFRRRKYMIISASLLVISTITLAYSVPISTALVDLFGGGLADWDPHRHQLVHSTTQIISVVAFWILDFALNGLQAASRALILDTAPSDQQTIANAWQGRMTHAGNVVGYLCGWVDLASWRGLRWLGGGQFRRFAVISLLAMISCVTITVACITESPSENNFDNNARRQSMCTSAWQATKATAEDVWHAIRRLPRSVRRVCLVQLFAFMGWFPFLFYSTTYVVQIAQYERMQKRRQHQDAFFFEPGGGEGRPSSDRDAERGSFAMLMFAVVALVSGALLPYLALAGEKGSSPPQLEDEEPPTPPLQLDMHSAQEHGRGDPEAEERLSRSKRLVRGLKHGLTLRTFWTLASLSFALLMLVGTAWASTVRQATVVIALVGVPWSVAAWAPFAMVGEFVREAEDGTSPFEFETDHWSPARTRARVEEGLKRRSFPSSAVDGGEEGARERVRASLVQCEPLPHTLTDSTESPDESTSHAHNEASGAGTILGIHNLAIVAPQFVVAIIASLIFSAAHSNHNGVHLVLGERLVVQETAGNPAEGTMWVLRFGGAMALIAAWATRYVPLTLSERKRRYGARGARDSVVDGGLYRDDPEDEM
ncbi:Major facilitator superfamily domain, general substrate transporter [Kalmanozyma brasiliensis GHG001]|uniref:Sucrose transporter n=1 Tax=Kalmanozyma brasiliensis (strain GHG001) TaxID=1365824 RepID=V5GGP4_KALBG|nr:Major facilitator superfamily domain, general substrate transporter [Kalmanozyma brasiliensis GHG001]EST05162.1 Major facilitator superfamily domain, general substrate transporter [Kalmanozyma brasiliensis GHG001]